MAKLNSLISIAQTLQQSDLYAFDSRTLANIFTLNKIQAAHLLHRLEEYSLVKRVERGKYILLGLTPERVLSNPLFIASSLATPSYVSFWSALHYHGYTDQAPREVYIATTITKPQVIFLENQFHYVTMKPHSFFGYQRDRIADLSVNIADEAKALMDSLWLPQYAGGLLEVARALWAALQKHDSPVLLNSLVEYSNRLGNGSLGSRLGYLLDFYGQTVHGLQNSSGPVSLDPQIPRCGKYNRRWKVYVNVEHARLSPEGVV